MLDEIIINLIQNRKRYLYAFVGFIVSLLLVTVGIFETIFILLVTFVGYCLGSPVFVKKAKKIKNILSEKFTFPYLLSGTIKVSVIYLKKPEGTLCGLQAALRPWGSLVPGKNGKDDLSWQLNCAGWGMRASRLLVRTIPLCWIPLNPAACRAVPILTYRRTRCSAATATTTIIILPGCGCPGRKKRAPFRLR